MPRGDHNTTLAFKQSKRRNPFFETEKGKVWFHFDGILNNENEYLRDRWLWETSTGCGNRKVFQKRVNIKRKKATKAEMEFRRANLPPPSKIGRPRGSKNKPKITPIRIPYKKVFIAKPRPTWTLTEKSKPIPKKRVNIHT